MDEDVSYPPWHLLNAPVTDSPLKELLSQVELPRTTSLYAPGTSSDWEQEQFWDQFLRSSTPGQLVQNMKAKVQEIGTFDMFDDDDYTNILEAVSRYQTSPMGSSQQLWEGQDMYALSTLLLSERVYLEGSWEPRRHRRKGSSATRYLWEESVVQLRRRRVSRQTSASVSTQRLYHEAVSTVEETVVTTTSVQINPEPAVTAFPVRRPQTKDCYFIAVLAFLTVAGSTTVGLYFSIAEDRMGDGFTTASYILAAGTMILGPWVATHYQHCNCRRTLTMPSYLSGSDESEIALVPFARSLTLDVL